MPYGSIAIIWSSKIKISMIKSKYPILSVLLALFLTCVLIPLSPALRPQEVAETVLPSTVLVTMTNASGQSYIGSGFVVGTGQIATNHHVIKGIASGKVKLVGDTTEHVIESVSIVDTNRDLAIVTASSLTASALTLGDSDTVQIGQAIYAAGNPRGLTGTFSQGIVSAIRPEGNIFVEDTIIQMTAAVSPGSSGGPVLNEDAEVIGVVFSQLTDGQNLNFMIPVNFLKTLLSELESNRLVNVPDPNLSAAFEIIFGKMRGDSIHVFEMESLTTLYIRNYNLRDLTGLEFATNLTVLNLGSSKIGNKWYNSNSFTDLTPLAGLTSLKGLDLDTASITNLSGLEGLANLTWLDLTINSVTDISALAGLTNLTELYLGGNTITGVSPLSDLTNLTTLYLWGNPVDDTSPLCRLQDQNPALELDIEITCGPYGLFMQDFNNDDQVNLSDLFFLLTLLFYSTSDGDLNNDGTIDFLDLVAAAEAATDSTTNSAPAFPFARTASVDTVQAWLDMAHAADDGSLTFQEGIANLERFLAAMQPHETELLPNYPNPFNPETWIPYHLARAADVTLTIYDTKGVLVRRFDLGHQAAGYYTDRTNAAYWDGRNASGEPVASGNYFYRLQAGDFSATRKLVILK